MCSRWSCFAWCFGLIRCDISWYIAIDRDIISYIIRYHKIRYAKKSHPYPEIWGLVRLVTSYPVKIFLDIEHYLELQIVLRVGPEKLRRASLTQWQIAQNLDVAAKWMQWRDRVRFWWYIIAFPKITQWRNSIALWVGIVYVLHGRMPLHSTLNIWREGVGLKL